MNQAIEALELLSKINKFSLKVSKQNGPSGVEKVKEHYINLKRSTSFIKK